MFRYILCEFEYGYTGRFYQKIDDQGYVVEMLDEQGNIIYPVGSYGAFVVDANPPNPHWAY
jgi:hypothetical protein